MIAFDIYGLNCKCLSLCSLRYVSKQIKAPLYSAAASFLIAHVTFAKIDVALSSRKVIFAKF